MASKANFGKQANSPAAIPARGWWQVLKRVYAEGQADNIGLIAAGVAFYGFLALIPLLGALVLTYGLVVAPSEVGKQMQAISGALPADAARLINEQLASIVSTAANKKGWGLLLALLLAFYGAMKGASAIIIALNVAYEQPETRSFIKKTLVAATVTLGAVLVAIAGLLAASAMAYLQHRAGDLSSVLAFVIKLASWLVAGLLASAAVAALYRYAPNRTAAKWSWVSPGALLATVAWVAMTLGFGLYASHFGNYNKTYGSLGAVVVLLLWLYLSTYVLLLGAELNAELEHQTEKDSTVGGASRSEVARPRWPTRSPEGAAAARCGLTHMPDTITRPGGSSRQ